MMNIESFGHQLQPYAAQIMARTRKGRAAPRYTATTSLTARTPRGPRHRQPAILSAPMPPVQPA